MLIPEVSTSSRRTCISRPIGASRLCCLSLICCVAPTTGTPLADTATRDAWAIMPTHFTLLAPSPAYASANVLFRVRSNATVRPYSVENLWGWKTWGPALCWTFQERVLDLHKPSLPLLSLGTFQRRRGISLSGHNPQIIASINSSDHPRRSCSVRCVPIVS